MSVPDTFLCKPFLCILTLTKYDELSIDQIWIIYRRKQKKFKKTKANKF